MSLSHIYNIWNAVLLTIRGHNALHTHIFVLVMSRCCTVAVLLSHPKTVSTKSQDVQQTFFIVFPVTRRKRSGAEQETEREPVEKRGVVGKKGILHERDC